MVRLFFSYIFTHTRVCLCVFHNHTPRDLVRTDTQLVCVEWLNEGLSSSPQAPFEDGSMRSGVLLLRVLVSFKAILRFPSQPC